MEKTVLESEFHITVARWNVPAAFDKLLREIKAAILYADRVKVFTSMYLLPLFARDRLHDFITPDGVYFIFKDYADAEAIQLYENAASSNVVRRLLENDEANSLLRAGNLGLLDLEGMMPYVTLPADEYGPERTFPTYPVVAKFAAYVLENPTHPIFDDTALDLFQSVSGKNIQVMQTKSHRKDVQLAFELFSKLPSFDNASLDQVIQIRQELQRPLVRFRAAMIEFSEKIVSEPWTEDFVSDVDVVFRRDIAPAILDIEERVTTDKYVSELAYEIADKSLLLPAGSAVAIAISHLSALPEITSRAAALGTLAGAASIMYKAFRDWQKKQQTISQNKLLFLYRAGKQLKDKHKHKAK